MTPYGQNTVGTFVAVSGLSPFFLASKKSAPPLEFLSVGGLLRRGRGSPLLNAPAASGENFFVPKNFSMKI